MTNAANVPARNLNARQDSRYKFPGVHYTLEEAARHEKLPTNLSYASWAGPVLDQGTYGDCVVHGTAGLFYLVSKKHDKIVREPSRSAWYAQIQRQLYPPPGDNGAESGDGLLMWSQHGWIPETLRPYPTANEIAELLAAVPPPEWRKDYPLVSFNRVNNDPLSIKRAMTSRGACIFGGAFAQSWTTQTNADGSLPSPDTVAGGHLWFNGGYSDTVQLVDDATGATSQGAFLSRNSWGPGYGFKPQGAETSGWFWLPYSIWTDYPQFAPVDVYVVSAN